MVAQEPPESSWLGGGRGAHVGLVSSLITLSLVAWAFWEELSASDSRGEMRGVT